MEVLEHTGRRNKKASFGTLLFLMCMFITPFASFQELQQITCPHGDFRTKSGICCNKCGPGLKLVKECSSPTERSNCTSCPDRQYMDQLNNVFSCNMCKKCKPKWHEIEKSPCQRDKNTVCSCEIGYYQYKIDSQTFQCLKCKTCESGEVEKQTCKEDHDTVCICKEGYYKVKKKCQPCTKNCSDECKRFCEPPGPDEDLTGVIAGVAAVIFVLFALGIVITYMTTKRFTKRKLLSVSSQSSDVSRDSREVLMRIEERVENNNVKTAVKIPMVEEEVSKLPDCVPLEIKVADVIYMVLDLVPVAQVKQLVRSLGVRDIEIEQAEMDHRSCREAHYQMLRMWAERASGGGGQGGMLHRPLLQELLEKLRMMHLEKAAEELETTYGIQ